VALLHHPVLDRQGTVATTTITSLDVHDLARSARTYGLPALYVVHPLPSQRELCARILKHWLAGPGGRRIPDRAAALAGVVLVDSVGEARAALADATSGPVELWTTAARPRGGETCSHAAARALLATAGPAVLLCFGTGWGLAPEVIDRADVRLAPIVGRAACGYNHLSVRAACAITLDRLLG
jgi:hypothetical protein